MDKDLFKVGADGIDTEAIVRDVKASVDRKMQDGYYNDPAVVKAEQSNFQNLLTDNDFSRTYIASLRQAVFVDINDFEIRERRRFIGAAIRLFKVLVWKLLKFYTYRLWSQQNHVNGLILTAVEGVEERYSRKVAELEKRLACLEENISVNGD